VDTTSIPPTSSITASASRTIISYGVVIELDIQVGTISWIWFVISSTSSGYMVGLGFDMTPTPGCKVLDAALSTISGIMKYPKTGFWDLFWPFFFAFLSMPIK